MPIDTTNEKLALLNLHQVWMPGLPMSPGAIDQADQQQLLWGYPGLLWGPLSVVDAEPIVILVDAVDRGFLVGAVDRTFAIEADRIFDVPDVG